MHMFQDTGIYICLVSIYSGDSRVNARTRRSQQIPLKVLEDTFRPQKPMIVDRFPVALPSAPIRGQNVRIECFAYGKSHGSNQLRYEWKRYDIMKVSYYISIPIDLFRMKKANLYPELSTCHSE